MERLEVLELLIREFAHNTEKITPMTTFKDLNMDSYDVVDFMSKVEEYFSTMIDNDLAMQAETIQDVLNALN